MEEVDRRAVRRCRVERRPRVPGVGDRLVAAIDELGVDRIVGAEPERAVLAGDPGDPGPVHEHVVGEAALLGGLATARRRHRHGHPARELRLGRVAQVVDGEALLRAGGPEEGAVLDAVRDVAVARVLLAERTEQRRGQDRQQRRVSRVGDVDDVDRSHEGEARVVRDHHDVAPRHVPGVHVLVLEVRQWKLGEDPRRRRLAHVVDVQAGRRRHEHRPAVVGEARTDSPHGVGQLRDELDVVRLQLRAGRRRESAAGRHHPHSETPPQPPHGDVCTTPCSSPRCTSAAPAVAGQPSPV